MRQHVLMQDAKSFFLIAQANRLNFIFTSLHMTDMVGAVHTANTTDCYPAYDKSPDQPSTMRVATADQPSANQRLLDSSLSSSLRRISRCCESRCRRPGRPAGHPPFGSRACAGWARSQPAPCCARRRSLNTAAVCMPASDKHTVLVAAGRCRHSRCAEGVVIVPGDHFLGLIRLEGFERLLAAMGGPSPPEELPTLPS